MLHPVFMDQVVHDRIQTLRADGAAARRSASGRGGEPRRWRRTVGAMLVSVGARIQGVAGTGAGGR
ncbi:MAG TPA: hypothetical protein VE669_10525 [Actinomycetota bacterium]|nr:hypothetical protein [Actinomycetota bacterium]